MGGVHVPQSVRWIVFLTLGLLLSDQPLLAQDAPKKKPLAVEDLYLLESVGARALLPKTKEEKDRLVYERVWIDPRTKQERHALWLVTENRQNRKPLEEGEPDGRAPVVSPDGQWIAFFVDPARSDRAAIRGPGRRYLALSRRDRKGPQAE